ncbi:hypothetical protein ACQQ2N_18705 [Dokdonella sp. MW10]|uniref:hypothetical protein n=1 Tax=Dokdonella sp. MW10 TaxID=2992926 RepID=UPI003F7F1BE0
MPLVTRNRSLRLVIVASLLALLTACGGKGAKPDAVAAGDVPGQFDVVLVAEKDDQFDYLEAPLTVEDLRAALRYRQEQALPMQTVLLKRGEKQKVKDSHVVALARIAVEMKFTAYVQEKDGISRIQATTKSE